MSSKQTKYTIQDWTGATKFNGEQFDSFEEAWDHIYENAENIDKYEDYGEFYVVEVKAKV